MKILVHSDTRSPPQPAAPRWERGGHKKGTTPPQSLPAPPAVADSTTDERAVAHAPGPSATAPLSAELSSLEEAEAVVPVVVLLPPLLLLGAVILLWCGGSLGVGGSVGGGGGGEKEGRFVVNYFTHPKTDTHQHKHTRTGGCCRPRRFRPPTC